MERKLAGRPVEAIGLGCMNLSHAYGKPPGEKAAVRLLHRAVELGVQHFDTAALYGFGKNEWLLGKALSQHRQEIFLASKCGLGGVDGKRVIDGRPETLLRTIDDALMRLQTSFIDLYYLHRWDRNVPIEDSVGAMARMVDAGKVGALGLSEVSAQTLRRAHAVHPIAAVQTEYSLFTRNAEIAVLDACRDIGAAFVAFSPLARGFLATPTLDPTGFDKDDIRRNMPRFQASHASRNQRLVEAFSRLARQAGCTNAQLALAWVRAQGNHVLAIPGTTSRAHLKENVETTKLGIDAGWLERAGELINARTVSGPRYPPASQVEVDTEEFSKMTVHGRASR
ncbi:MAG: aldo/keto reductase [Gammaproteobacteria bacterium]|nr:aldo/keto reductase [Gammaproteobacteria bacterium]